MEKNFEKLSIEKMSLVSGGAWTSSDYICLGSALVFVGACGMSFSGPAAWAVAGSALTMLGSCGIIG